MPVQCLVLLCRGQQPFIKREGNEAIFCLNNPHTGFYLPTMAWKDMYDFSNESVLLVLESEHYDPDEYIRDYDMFVREITGDSQKS